MGQNYPAHAREMGRDPLIHDPVFFCKGWGCALCVDDEAILPMPPQTRNLQPEVELVALLGAGGCDLSVAQAEDAIFAYGVGLDMTRRDLQLEARKNAMPWDLAKNFTGSAPIGRLMAKELWQEQGAISLTINDAVKQSAYLDERIWKTAHALSILSRTQHLHAGDVLFTGTPRGLHRVRKGDRLGAHIEGLPSLCVTLA